MNPKNPSIAHQSLSTIMFSSQKQLNNPYSHPQDPSIHNPIYVPNDHTLTPHQNLKINPRYTCTPTKFQIQIQNQATPQIHKKSSHARKNSATNTCTSGNNNANSVNNAKKRNKNKCQTQAHHQHQQQQVGIAQRLLQCQSSRNKRNTQTLEKSKKTLRKQKQKIKSSQAQTSILLTNKLKSSQHNNRNTAANDYQIYQQSLTLKSSGKSGKHINHSNRNTNNSYSKTHQKSTKSSNNNAGSNTNNNISSKMNKNWTAKKQLFQSTCFSRHIDQDLQFMEEIFQSGSQMNMNVMATSHNINVQAGEKLCNNDNSSITENEEIHIDLSGNYNQIQKGKYGQENYKLKGILQRAKLVLNAYHNKCSQLSKNCEYYKSQLNKANKQLMRASRNIIQGKHSTIANNSNNNSNALKKSNHSAGNQNRSENKYKEQTSDLKLMNSINSHNNNISNNERKGSIEKSRDFNNNNNNVNKSSIRSTHAGKF